MVETLTMSGRIACATGRIQDAKEFYHEALAIAVNIQSEPVVAYVFIGLAELLRREGKELQAAEMLAFASRYSGFPDARAEAARLRREIEASLQPGAWNSAQETGRRLHLEQVVERFGADVRRRGSHEIPEYLSLSVSFDYDLVDGAPAARFVQRLKELVESGYGIEQAAEERG
ncbi:MAG: hypothetical protein IPM84_14495 [Anaerolineae bacterium]|nr:hypothetical protein [Anaerolineae bacterium]